MNKKLIDYLLVALVIVGTVMPWVFLFAWLYLSKGVLP